MKISIITVCLNASGTIRDTIESVLSQSYPGIEYIVMDGGSADGTVDIVRSYGEKINYFNSSRDEGMYFAINEGIRRATGDIIGLLHADDMYVSSYVLERVADMFGKTGADSVYGDLVYVNAHNPGKTERYWQAGEYRPGLFRKGWMPPHPAFFLKASAYKKYGAYDTRFRSAADYELMLRMLHKFNVSTAYLPEVLVKMRSGGRSNVRLLNRIKANLEDRKAWKVNGLKAGWLTLTIKPLRKLGQFRKSGK